MKTNYQIVLENTLKQIENINETPKLLLHSCCAPCSSYVLEYLSNYFKITIYYYNPNISPKEEFQHRAKEQINLIKKLHTKYPIEYIIGPYENEIFRQLSKGLEHLQEGGARCIKCYYMRLESTALLAKKNHFDFFTTTLSISPHKDSEKLNEIGTILEKKYEIPYLYSDFKKKNGYKRSIELSQLYNLYRQNYCGCEFSKNIELGSEKNEK